MTNWQSFRCHGFAQQDANSVLLRAERLHFADVLYLHQMVDSEGAGLANTPDEGREIKSDPRERRSWS